MSTRDDVLALLRQHPDGRTDAQVAAVLGVTHQRANQIGRTLAAEGIATRDASTGTIVTSLVDSTAGADGFPRTVSSAAATSNEADTAQWDDDHEWSWEGNVQARVVEHLRVSGWRVVSAADTASRERGFDVVAERGATRLLVEVKGWPSTTYSRGDRAGEPKPTQPTLQAGHWLATGLLAVMRAPAKEPHARLALALPDMPRYRSLLADIDWALRRLDVVVLLVDEHGSVDIANEPVTL